MEFKKFSAGKETYGLTLCIDKKFFNNFSILEDNKDAMRYN